MEFTNSGHTNYVKFYSQQIKIETHISLQLLVVSWRTRNALRYGDFWEL